MPGEIEDSWAMRSLRLLLIRHGLSEQQADAFLQELRTEFERGTLSNEESRRAFYGRQAERLAGSADDRKAAGSQKGKYGKILETVMLGAAGSGLYELLKFAVPALASHISDDLSPTTSKPMPIYNTKSPPPPVETALPLADKHSLGGYGILWSRVDRNDICAEAHTLLVGSDSGIDAARLLAYLNRIAKDGAHQTQHHVYAHIGPRKLHCVEVGTVAGFYSYELHPGGNIYLLAFCRTNKRNQILSIAAARLQHVP